MPPANYEKVKYDLMRIGFDVETGAWGEVETVLSSKDTGLSITQPRFSPDGRFLVFCMSDYSTFPTFQPSSDLYLMDLKTGRYGRMECNSDRAESWHCWSSNSRWLVFSSKRGNGLLNRPYFSYIDEDGKAHKPFVMPQKDPAFYDSFLKLYQLPELVTGPVRPGEQEFARAVSAQAAVPVKSKLPATPSDCAGRDDSVARPGGATGSDSSVIVSSFASSWPPLCNPSPFDSKPPAVPAHGIRDQPLVYYEALRAFPPPGAGISD